MPKKIIEEIKKAEGEALEIRKSADTSVKEIIDKALKEADEIRKSATLEAEKEYEKSIEAAKKSAEARIDENRRLSYENAAAVTETAKKNTDNAASFIINSILEG